VIRGQRRVEYYADLLALDLRVVGHTDHRWCPTMVAAGILSADPLPMQVPA
jgi:hypothetical protein